MWATGLVKRSEESDTEICYAQLLHMKDGAFLSQQTMKEFSFSAAPSLTHLVCVEKFGTSTGRLR